jgi:hypothetical protein
MKTSFNFTNPIYPLALFSVLCCGGPLELSAQTSCAPPSDGLVAWWRAEGNTLDSAGIYHGLLSGNTSYGVGRVGQGFVFDGSNDAVLLGNPSALQLQDFTIEAWVKRASTSRSSFDFNGGVIFGYGQGGYNLSIFDNGTPFLGRVGVDYVTSNARITDTNMHHLAVTKLGTSVVLYVDGVAYPAPPYGTAFTFGTPAAIGARGDNQVNGFWGMVDELAFYNRPLAAAEIQSIYNAGGVGKCTQPVAPVIFVDPTNQIVYRGETARFSVAAGGTLPLMYQWKHAGNNLPGATNAVLSVTNVQTIDLGAYSVGVTNSVSGVISAPASLLLKAINVQVLAELTIEGPVGSNAIVEFSNDLLQQQWQPLTNFVLPSSPYRFIDYQSRGVANRFYRVSF